MTVETDANDFDSVKLVPLVFKLGAPATNKICSNRVQMTKKSSSTISQARVTSFVPVTVEVADCMGVAASDNLFSNSFINPCAANGAGSTFLLVNLEQL